MSHFFKRFLILFLCACALGCGDSENFVFTQNTVSGDTPLQGRLVFLTTPAREAGQAFNTIQVGVQDLNGQLLINSTIPVTIELVNPQGATLSGTTTRNAVNGVATFDDLTVNIAGNYEFRATSPGFESEDSVAFEITPSTPEGLNFAVQPADSTTDVAIAPAIQVQVVDQFGNLTNSTVTLALQNNPTSATLGGTLIKDTVNGVATFDDITLNNAGTGYTLSATIVGADPQVSEAFDVIAPESRLFVSNVGNSTITVYDVMDDENATPLRTIGGPNTQLDSPQGIFVSGGELFVADSGTPNSGDGFVLVFSAGADGNAEPLRVLTGVNTGFDEPAGVLVENGELFVAGEGEILVFPADAVGNVSPTRSIVGNMTRLETPGQMATDGTSLFVADTNSGPNGQTFEGAVLSFGLADQDNVPPSTFIDGVTSQVVGPRGIAVSLTEVFVNSVRSMPRRLTVYAIASSGDAPPARSFESTGGQIALFDNELYMTGDDAILVFPDSAMGSPSATRTITGGNTGLNGDSGIAIGLAP